jgi:hypothetical protein
MIKQISFCICLLVIGATSQAQFDTLFAKKNLLSSADSLVKGFKTRDWDLYTRYSNPGLVGSMGGREPFINYISTSFANIPDSAWKKYEKGNVLQIVKTPGDLQAIIEMHSVVEWQHMKVITISHLVAESWDGGLFWTFFDSQNDPAATRMIKQDISTELIIPKRFEKIESIKRN